MAVIFSSRLLGQHLVALTQHIHQYGFHSAYEALHGYHHQDEAHEAHHDVVACLAQYVYQACGGTQDEVGQQVDERDGTYQHAFQLQGVRILHQHDGIVAPGPQSMGMPSGVMEMSSA